MARRAKRWPGTKEGQAWQEWKDAIWDQMANVCGVYRHSGLASLEQYMHRSAYEKRCIECGEPGVAEQHSQIIKSVDVYWMCQDCADYWTDRAAREQASAPPRRPRRKKGEAA